MCLPKSNEDGCAQLEPNKAPQGDGRLELRGSTCLACGRSWAPHPAWLKEEEAEQEYCPPFTSASQEAEEGRSQPRGQPGLPGETIGKQCSGVHTQVDLETEERRERGERRTGRRRKGRKGRRKGRRKKKGRRE